jgi:hypothetical protein
MWAKNVVRMVFFKSCKALLNKLDLGKHPCNSSDSQAIRTPSGLPAFVIAPSPEPLQPDRRSSVSGVYSDDSGQ